MPGAIEAWDAILKAHGTWPLDRALAPAIQYAEDGFPVAPRVASDWTGPGRQARQQRRRDQALSVRTAARPQKATSIKLPALAATLKAIAKDGAQRVLRGRRSPQDMVATLAARGSVLTAEDFAAHRGEVVTPISTNYRGVDLVEIPPNTQGLTALVTLNILENFDLAALDAARAGALSSDAGGGAASAYARARRAHRRAVAHARAGRRR